MQNRRRQYDSREEAGIQRCLARQNNLEPHGHSTVLESVIASRLTFYREVVHGNRICRFR